MLYEIVDEKRKEQMNFKKDRLFLSFFIFEEK